MSSRESRVQASTSCAIGSQTQTPDSVAQSKVHWWLTCLRGALFFNPLLVHCISNLLKSSAFIIQCQGGTTQDLQQNTYSSVMTSKHVEWNFKWQSKRFFFFKGHLQCWAVVAVLFLTASIRSNWCFYDPLFLVCPAVVAVADYPVPNNVVNSRKHVSLPVHRWIFPRKDLWDTGCVYSKGFHVFGVIFSHWCRTAA